MKNQFFLFSLVLAIPLAIFAQDDSVVEEAAVEEAVWGESGTVAGTVSDVSSGGVLPGANVVVEGTDLGAAADESGSFVIENVPAGSYTVTASVMGYKASSETVTVGAGTAVLNFSLSASVLQMSGLEVLASRAGENTPVAYSNVSKADMEFRLGSQDIPLALNATPSVYATAQGGGAGDARVNVRGFNQRNVAVMINGVPQNDMENGWVYWSNWDGVGDVTSSIQMQRGLSAVNLAAPSIGGTMNVITDPTAMESGGMFKQELGAGNFLKTTANYSTGLINDTYALSATVVRKTGDGVIDKQWTDAWAYYLGASYAVDENNRFELYAIGAPQRHGQNLWKQNAAAYDQDFAKNELGYAQAALDNFSEATTHDLQPGAESGRFYSQNWAKVSPSYEGKQYMYMYGAKTQDRHDPNFINERENFFHKPLVNLNHFMTLNDQMRLSSVFYWSGGSGGGSGTYRNNDGFIWDYSGPSRIFDLDATIAMNESDETRKGEAKGLGESDAILRNSINRQDTYGLISKINYDLNDETTLEFGVDWRTAEIEHAREVRDLLGGDYFVETSDDNRPDGYQAGLGDIIAYHNTNTVDWMGLFAQGNYTKDALSAYGTFGWSSVTYTHTNYFLVGKPKFEADPITATQFKAGVMYDLGGAMSMLSAVPVIGKVGDQAKVFFNFGNVQKVPILDNVIDDNNGTISTDPLNETFTSLEAGLKLRSDDGSMWGNINLYNTQWKDRNQVKYVASGSSDGADAMVFLTGVGQIHQGVEFEANAQMSDMFSMFGAASFGTWQHDGDASGTYKNYDTGEQAKYDYALDGLRIGDQPQWSVVLGPTLTPMDGMKLQAIWGKYARHFADWGPSSREYDGSDADADRNQSWETPGYSKVDLHAYYDLNVSGYDLTLFLHVFNALDAIYVQDAVDNSSYNGYYSNETGRHNAMTAEVFLGAPRYFNAGVTFKF